MAAGDTFTTAELRVGVAEALGIEGDACTLGSLRHELWKLRALLTAGLLHPYRGNKAFAKDRLQQLDRLYRSVTAALDQLVAAVGLKVAA